MMVQFGITKKLDDIHLLILTQSRQRSMIIILSFVPSVMHPNQSILLWLGCSFIYKRAIVLI